MKRLFFIALAALVATTSLSADEAAVEQSVIDRWETDRTQVFYASEVSLPELQWIARAVVVFADSPNDPMFRQQMDLLLAEIDRLVERDVILITDTDPAARNSVRLDLRPR